MGSAQRTLRKALRIALPTVLCSLSLVYIIRTFQWPEILEVFEHVNLLYFLGGGSATILLYWLVRSIRFFLMLRSRNIRIPFVVVYVATAMSLSLSILIPLQLGEALKVEILRKYRVLDRLPGYSLFLSERLFDLALVLMMSSTYAAAFVPARGLLFLAGAAVLALCGLAIVDVLTGRKLKRIAVESLDVVSAFFGDVRLLGVVFLLTSLSWGLIGVGWWVCLRCVGVNISIMESFPLTGVITLISLLSLVPGGVGVSEASIEMLLVHRGQAHPTAQAGAIILRAYGLLMLLLGAFHWGVWRQTERLLPKDARRGQTDPCSEPSLVDSSRP